MFKIALLLLLMFSTPLFAEDIELSADNGLVWDQKESKITMNENAIAKTKDYTLTANEIEAFYKGNKKIYRIIAIGNVSVVSANEKINTDKLIYNLNDEIINLIPDTNPVKMKTKTSEIIAKDEIFYYRNKNYATAKNAEITHAERKLFADNIKITFQNQKSKNPNDIENITATGNIKLIDGEEELYGDIAEYNPKNGFATLTGNVRLKKGTQANLQGGEIVYDMNTGIAKILPKTKGEKVKGTFSTDK